MLHNSGQLLRRPFRCCCHLGKPLLLDLVKAHRMKNLSLTEQRLQKYLPALHPDTRHLPLPCPSSVLLFEVCQLLCPKTVKLLLDLGQSRRNCHSINIFSLKCLGQDNCWLQQINKKNMNTQIALHFSIVLDIPSAWLGHLI